MQRSMSGRLVCPVAFDRLRPRDCRGKKDV